MGAAVTGIGTGGHGGSGALAANGGNGAIEYNGKSAQALFGDGGDGGLFVGTKGDGRNHVALRRPQAPNTAP